MDDKKDKRNELQREWRAKRKALCPPAPVGRPKKVKVDSVPTIGKQQCQLLQMREYLRNNDRESCIQLNYDLYLRHGQRILSDICQTAPMAYTPNPHLWIYGDPGMGKTALLRYIYPSMYKKDLNGHFWELYNPTVHTHVILEDLDHENVEKLGIQFLKTICDEGGFTVDQKFKSISLARTSVLVTSNFTIKDVVPCGKGEQQTCKALHRRFRCIDIANLLYLVELKLQPIEVRRQAILEGSMDGNRIFQRWDYINNQPIEGEIPSSVELANKLRDCYL